MSQAPRKCLTLLIWFNAHEAILCYNFNCAPFEDVETEA